MRSSASESVLSGLRYTGSTMTPCSERFTFSTSLHCSSMLIFLWITPIPPSRAMAIAISDSVTVSIPALITGIFKVMFRVKRVETSTSLGSTSECAGTKRTSSKVSPFFPNLSSLIFTSIFYRCIKVILKVQAQNIPS